MADDIKTITLSLTPTRKMFILCNICEELSEIVSGNKAGFVNNYELCVFIFVFSQKSFTVIETNLIISFV
jgi:hypothetical protein